MHRSTIHIQVSDGGGGGGSISEWRQPSHLLENSSHAQIHNFTPDCSCFLVWSCNIVLATTKFVLEWVGVSLGSWARHINVEKYYNISKKVNLSSLPGLYVLQHHLYSDISCKGKFLSPNIGRLWIILMWKKNMKNFEGKVQYLYQSLIFISKFKETYYNVTWG